MAKFKYRVGQSVKIPDGHSGTIVSRKELKGAKRYVVRDRLGHELPYLEHELSK